jgi:hypothetical protein
MIPSTCLPFVVPRGMLVLYAVTLLKRNGPTTLSTCLPLLTRQLWLRAVRPVARVPMQKDKCI